MFDVQTLISNTSTFGLWSVVVFVFSQFPLVTEVKHH